MDNRPSINGYNISDSDIEKKCKCGHKLGWHHANAKYQGKILICYGIACLCEKYVSID